MEEQIRQWSFENSSKIKKLFFLKKKLTLPFENTDEMNREEIVNIVNDFLVEEFEADRSMIQESANLKQTLDLDSLDYVDLVVVIEANFGVKLGESDFANIATFADFYNLIEAKIK